MESLLVCPLVEVVLDKLASGLWKELGLLGDVKKDVRKLQSTLSTIKDVLEDAEQRSTSDKSLLNWLKKLKDAAYDADDVVDELQTEALRAKARGRLKEEVIDFFSSHNPMVFRRTIALKIKDVLERLTEIAEEKNNFHLAHGPALVRSRNEETHSVATAPEVYGRDEDKEKIVNYLLNEDTNKALSVVAVVGLGGVGKTTLAQLVYNDERIKSSFDINAWVCVSEEFDVKVITRKTIQCIRKEANCNDLDLDPLGQLLRKILSGKRFMLVLDDVWNEDQQKWESLESLFRCGEKGSKIVVTTRSADVARVMNSVLLQRLNVLSADDCWRLFRERAFGLGREEETPRLIEIGKMIVNKGGGLPLAAKALGSLMGSKKGESEWLAIGNSEIWSFGDDENKILHALRLSYFHLPSQVKKCFVYCSLFHKDYNFNKEKLIRQWLGEGLVPSLSQGSEYFNSLLRRSFFDVVNTSTKKWYKIHDLIHDLAYSAGKDEFCSVEVRKVVKVLDNCRYLSLYMNDDMFVPILRFSCETKKLRSLLLTRNSYRISEIAWDTVLQLHCIRLLDLSSSGISMLPSTLWRLKHLRFIDCSYTYIKALPPTINRMYNLSMLILAGCSKLTELPSTLCSVPNLSTLDLRGCRHLGELPNGLSRLTNLIHLDIQECDGLRQTPPAMGRLTNLQTLSRFVVGEEDGCHITELNQLNQIRSPLEICNLHKVTNASEAGEANLKAKVSVKELKLHWSTEKERRGNERAAVEEESVIENLRPPPYLEVLIIEDYHGIRVPSWWTQTGSPETPVSLFQSLVRLQLFGLKWCEGLPQLGQLPLLKKLEIRGMDGVRRIGGEGFYGHTRAGGTCFPSLDNLEFRDMPNVEEWVVEAGEVARESMFPSLSGLEIRDCPKLRVVGFGLPMSLVDVRILRCSEVSGRCFVGLSRLKRLTIHMSAAAEGLRCLSALDELVIDSDFGDLTGLLDGECRIPSLRSLCMWHLQSLTSLGSGDLQQRIQPPSLFTTLSRLELVSCEELTVLPEWLGCLTSLQSLCLRWCPKLEMLPDSLQHLATLQRLHIGGCPILEQRCVRETGEDWHKISHIPHIRAGGSRI